jgi:hypothetical protein
MAAPLTQPKQPSYLLIGALATVVALLVSLGTLALVDSGGGPKDAPQSVQAAPEQTTETTQTKDAGSQTEAPAAPAVEQPPASEQAPANQPQPLPDLNLQAVSAGDRFSIPRFGVDAPLSFRVVGEDGRLEDPDGSDDVSYYNFSTWPGYGGGPGIGGNAVFAGHVDSGFAPCRNGTVPPPCAAVLWDLNKIVQGDEITVTIAGETYRYGVISNEAVSEDAEWAPIFASGQQETLTVITCGGDFNPQTHNYDKRQVVTAVRMPD